MILYNFLYIYYKNHNLSITSVGTLATVSPSEVEVRVRKCYPQQRQSIRIRMVGPVQLENYRSLYLDAYPHVRSCPSI